MKDMKNFSECVACICIGLVLVFCSGCGASKPKQESSVPKWNSAAASRDLFERSNEARGGRGLHVLTWSDELAVLAQDHAQKMAAKERLSHDGFQRRSDELRQRGVVTRLTENVAMSKGHADPVAITIRGWIDSSGHRRNLYDREVAMTGVGFAISRDGMIYCAQLYGR